MTTASRVSDSREAFEAWKLQCGCDAKSTLMDYLKTAFNRGWRDALACQGPVVTVSDLREVASKMDKVGDMLDDMDSYSCTAVEDIVYSYQLDLTALIAKANGHE